MVTRRPSAEPSLLVAVWWLFLAAMGFVMFLGGISFLLGVSHGKPGPAPTVTVTETQIEQPDVSDTIPDSVIEDSLSSLPTPSACTEADAQGTIPRDRWAPCGQLLGYFDDTTPSP
ncbi:hypothetical protein [Streptomyces spinosisporus]|uniref:Uncharacterized protein n=1 Tax=Streptomyces spinosisporus TaxID=2927582 RepID=A0ABS9XEH3_9ACTN|nr:hypothetical protein [Streptomyces spinosisporus]MCI3240495.1 hypothetical protein [Streptomyces spinosisporus]